MTLLFWLCFPFTLIGMWLVGVTVWVSYGGQPRRERWQMDIPGYKHGYRGGLLGLADEIRAQAQADKEQIASLIVISVATFDQAKAALQTAREALVYTGFCCGDTCIDEIDQALAAMEAPQ